MLKFKVSYSKFNHFIWNPELGILNCLKVRLISFLHFLFKKGECIKHPPSSYIESIISLSYYFPAAAAL